MKPILGSDDCPKCVAAGKNWVRKPDIWEYFAVRKRLNLTAGELVPTEFMPPDTGDCRTKDANLAVLTKVPAQDVVRVLHRQTCGEGDLMSCSTSTESSCEVLHTGFCKKDRGTSSQDCGSVYSRLTYKHPESSLPKSLNPLLAGAVGGGSSLGVCTSDANIPVGAP